MTQSIDNFIEVVRLANESVGVEKQRGNERRIERYFPLL